MATGRFSFPPDTCLANWIYKGAGLSFLILPWKFWEFWYFFFISSVLVEESSVFQQSSAVCNSFTQPKILYGRAQKRLLADLLLAEQLSTVPAMVTPLSEWKTDCTARTAVSPLILYPVISCRSARLITYGPAEYSASTIPNKNSAVISARKKQKHSCNNSGTVTCRHWRPILHVGIRNTLNYRHSN